METGAETKTEQTVVAPAETPVTTEPAQEKTYTQKDLDRIIAEHKEREEARVKGLNKVVSKKDTEIEALKKTASPSEATLPILRKMAKALEETISQGYGDEAASKSAKSKLAEINTEITQMQVRTEQSKTEAIRDGMWARIKELGLNPDPTADDYDERLDPVITFWTAGNIQMAQQRLDKLAAKLEKEKGNVAEQAAAKVDVSKLEAEIRAKIIKEYNLDSQDTGSAGGGVPAFTAEQVAKMDEATYAKNREAIQQAINAGRFK